MDSSLLSTLREQMLQHPYHTITPHQRALVYAPLARTPDGAVQRVYLSALSCVYIHELWRHSPIAPLMRQSLASLQRALAGDGYPTRMADIRALDRRLRKPGLGDDLFFSGYAMLRTLEVMQENDVFNHAVIDAETIDAELGPDHSDPTGCAVAAFAHGLYDEDATPERRRIFWEWWLQHAVPLAFRPWSRAHAEDLRLPD